MVHSMTFLHKIDLFVTQAGGAEFDVLVKQIVFLFVSKHILMIPRVLMRSNYVTSKREFAHSTAFLRKHHKHFSNHGVLITVIIHSSGFL